MKTLKFVIFVASAACLQAQTPAEKAWTILSSAAQDKDHETRSAAIHALGEIRNDGRARSTAEGALTDEKEDVRAAAAEALGNMRAKESAPKLKSALNDHETSVVFAAANSLFVIGDPAAYQVYYAVLTGQRKSGDALLESQMKMIKDPKALAKLGFEQGIGFVPFGGIAYGAMKAIKSDTVTPIRAAAVVKLINDPDPNTSQALVNAAKDDKFLVRAAVAGAIARRGDPALLPAVVILLDDKNDVVRFNAAAAVIGLSSVVPYKARRSSN